MMKGWKKFSYVLMFILSSSFALAQFGDFDLIGILQPFAAIGFYLFQWLPHTYPEAAYRLYFFFLMGTIFTFLVELLPFIKNAQGGKRRANVIAFLFAAIIASAMPNGVLGQLFGVYALVLVILLFGLLPFGLYYITRGARPWLRGILMIVTSLLLKNSISSLTNPNPQMVFSLRFPYVGVQGTGALAGVSNIESYLNIIVFLVFVTGIYHLLFQRGEGLESALGGSLGDLDSIGDGDLDGDTTEEEKEQLKNDIQAITQKISQFIDVSKRFDNNFKGLNSRRPPHHPDIQAYAPPNPAPGNITDIAGPAATYLALLRNGYRTLKPLATTIMNDFSTLTETNNITYRKLSRRTRRKIENNVRKFIRWKTLVEAHTSVLISPRDGTGYGEPSQNY